MSRDDRPLVLTVAGSDSSGGAGLQADLATFAAEGCRGATVVTAVTAQGSRGVAAWEPVSAALVRAQLVLALDELHPAAVKTGMLATAEIVGLVAEELAARARVPTVCDPVAAASSGHALLLEDGLAALRERLLPLVTLLTPNAGEAAALTGLPVRDPDEAEAAGRRLLDSGCGAVLVKGGHFARGRGTDVLVTGDGPRRFVAEPIEGPDVHGTGCVLSAAIACGLARGWPLERTVQNAKERVLDRMRGRS